MNKIRLSYLWVFAIVLLPFFHLTKIIAFVFIILSLHESAHVLVALLFHYKIDCITIYPFGFSADIPHLGYGNLIKETCIICAGPLSQVLFPIFFKMLVQIGWISNGFCDYLTMINASILMFNLLPIYPLDGGRLLQTFFHCIFRFRFAQQCTCIASLCVLVLLFTSQLLKGMSALVMQCFLLFQIILCYHDITHMQLKFYHYRLHHPVSYDVILNQRKDLFRGRYNIMKMEQGYIPEENWLHRKFTNEKKDSRKAS